MPEIKRIVILAAVTFVEALGASLLVIRHPTSQVVVGLAGAAASVTYNTVIKPALEKLRIKLSS